MHQASRWAGKMGAVANHPFRPLPPMPPPRLKQPSAKRRVGPPLTLKAVVQAARARPGALGPELAALVADTGDATVTRYRSVMLDGKRVRQGTRAEWEARKGTEEGGKGFLPSRLKPQCCYSQTYIGDHVHVKYSNGGGSNSCVGEVVDLLKSDKLFMVEGYEPEANIVIFRRMRFVSATALVKDRVFRPGALVYQFLSRVRVKREKELGKWGGGQRVWG